MKSIESLQLILEDILGSGNVYFQPPENIRINYPCFLYFLGKPDQKFADNITYLYTRRFMLTYIRKSADIDDLPYKIVSSLPMCVEDRTYIKDNLYHTIFYFYY